MPPRSCRLNVTCSRRIPSPPTTTGRRKRRSRLRARKGHHSRVIRLLIAAALSCVAFTVHAQGSVVRIVVPFAAGGVQDILARAINAELGTQLGRGVIVENRPGAGNTIGTAFVAKAPPPPPPPPPPSPPGPPPPAAPSSLRRRAIPSRARSTASFPIIRSTISP